MIEKITLTPIEIATSVLIGATRHKEALRQNKQDSNGFKGNPLNIHIEGAIGEQAVSKYLNIFWGGLVNSYQVGGDVGKYQVRTSKNDYLLVRPNNKDDDIYIAVKSLNVTEHIILGWMSAKEAKNDKWKKSPGNRPPAYFVPASALYLMTSLLQEGK